MVFFTIGQTTMSANDKYNIRKIYDFKRLKHHKYAFCLTKAINLTLFSFNLIEYMVAYATIALLFCHFVLTKQMVYFFFTPFWTQSRQFCAKVLLIAIVSFMTLKKFICFLFFLHKKYLKKNWPINLRFEIFNCVTLVF